MTNSNSGAFLNKADWFITGDDPKASLSDTIQFHLDPPIIRKRRWRTSNGRLAI